MNRAQFVLALWGMTGLAAGLKADDCGCQPAKPCACQCQDDSGILDHIDKVAGQFHASFRKNLKLPIHIGMKTSSCDCDASPSCGTELKPSCGCEQKPTCGCEISAHGKGSIIESNSPPTATHSSQPTQPVFKQHSTPSSVPPQPVPDTQINPFSDEAPRSGQSKVRGRTIEYRSDSQPNFNLPSSTQPGRVQLKASPTPSPKSSYGQKYNSQANRVGTQPPMGLQPTQPTRSLQLVAPASSESTTVEQVFQAAYRKNLSDTPVTTPDRNPELRPVPNAASSSKNTKSGDNDTRTIARVIVPTEPIRDLNDPYEREESPQLRAQENPLRR